MITLYLFKHYDQESRQVIRFSERESSVLYMRFLKAFLFPDLLKFTCEWFCRNYSKQKRIVCVKDRGVVAPIANRWFIQDYCSLVLISRDRAFIFIREVN